MRATARARQQGELDFQDTAPELVPERLRQTELPLLEGSSGSIPLDLFSQQEDSGRVAEQAPGDAATAAPDGTTSAHADAAFNNAISLRRESAEAEAVREAPWLRALGLSDRAGLWRIGAEVKAAAQSQPGTLSILCTWPSAPPSPMLAWAASHLGYGAAESKPIRALFVGGGRADIRLLAECSISRAGARPLWIPDLNQSITPNRDAMACAFLPGRLKPGAPEHLPLHSLVPVVHSRPMAESPWPDTWKGFMAGAREFLRGDRGGMFGFPWHRYGDARTTRPFGFVLPQVSRGARRTREIEAIPGGLDLVVVDLSASWMSPSRVAKDMSEVVLDAAAAAGNGPAPRFLVMVSDPRAFLAALGQARDLRDNEIIAGRTERAIIHHVGDRTGRVAPAVSHLSGKIVVHAASTSEGDVQADLIDLARSLEATHPKSCDALIQAARTLASMARSLAPPLADTDDPEVTWTFVDAAREVREALREEGDPPEIAGLNACLDRGVAAATRLLRNSPARIALRDATAHASRGRRVAFVAEADNEALEAARQAPDNLMIASRRTAASEISSFAPDLLVTACRGADALRILAELSRPAAETVMLLPPADAATASRIAELVLEQPELAPSHELCRAVLDALPPSFMRLRSTGDVFARHDRRRRGGQATRPSGSGAPRDAIVLRTDDGEASAFAHGSTVISIVDGEPVARRASKLEPGDVVVVMPEDLGDRIARELGWEGEAALLDEHVARYKARVRAWRDGSGRDLTARRVIAQMRAIDPDMPEPSEAAVRYWLAGADAEDEAAPHASGNARWLSAFLKVIGLDGADGLFVHFGHYRGRLQREGHLRSGLLERFLFDPYDAVVQRGVSEERARELRAIALSHAREVVDVDRRGAEED